MFSSSVVSNRKSARSTISKESNKKTTPFMTAGQDGPATSLSSRPSSSQESTSLLAYKNKALNSINSNYVNHKLLKKSPSVKVPTNSGSTAANPKAIPSTSSLKVLSKGQLVETSRLYNAIPDQIEGGSPSLVDEHDCKALGCERVRINVSGQYFEMRVGLLNRHPGTLLGDPKKRQQFYDRTRDEFFIDRHRPSFEAVFSYFQNGGKLKRPHNVPDDVFLTEIDFYELEKSVVDEYRQAEGYVDHEVVVPSNGMMRTIWLLFEYPETSNLAFLIALVSVIMTLISIVLFCVETLPVFSVSHCVGDEAPNFLDPFFVIETTCTMWFTLEIVIRFTACPNKLTFWKDLKNIIDVCAIIPYYITFINVVSTMSCASAKSSASLAFLRVVRLIRVFKLTKHFVALQVLVLTFKASIEGLGLFLVALMVCLLVFSSAIYYAELGTKGTQISSIPDAFWWAIITMTTVGYGDKVPVGPWGRLIGSICAITGVLTLAIPVPIITGNFNRFYAHRMGRGKHIG